MRPLVSILMPCYNAEKFLRYSLESILNQDYNNLEVICIDDGSTDGTLKLLEEYESADTRLVIIKNKTNLGLIKSLNLATTIVHGEFFARMDADDFSPPDRISKQVDFLKKNAQYDLVASGHYYFVHDGKKLEYVPPIGTLPESLKFISLFSTLFTHGSTMGRTDLITKGFFYYDKDYPHSEDYELFSRLAWQNIRMANMADPVYWLRQNPDSVSIIYNDIQIRSHLKITERNLGKLKGTDPVLTDTFLKIITNRINVPVRFEDVQKAFKYLDECLGLYLAQNKVSESAHQEIKSYLTLHKLNILIQSNKIGMIRNKTTHVSFFMSSWTLLRTNHMKGIFLKTYNFIRHRLF